MKFAPIKYFAPHERAPEFVKGNMIINKHEFIEFLKDFDTDQINLDIKSSKKGKLYVAVNEYKHPEFKEETRKEEDKPLDANDLPF